eukprot:Gb_14326 [translate_table: standard]
MAFRQSFCNILRSFSHTLAPGNPSQSSVTHSTVRNLSSHIDPAASKCPSSSSGSVMGWSSSVTGDSPMLCGRGDKKTKKGKRFKAVVSCGESMGINIAAILREHATLGEILTVIASSPRHYPLSIWMSLMICPRTPKATHQC